MGKVNSVNVNGDTYSTEIISMGMQEMWHDPVGFATKDPDYFDFIIDLLRGLL